jgi:hypothetical protein
MYRWVAFPAEAIKASQTMRPKVLLIALSDWFGPARLPHALRDAGFDVGVMASPEGMLAQSSYIDYRFDLSVPLIRLGVIEPFFRSILEFAPRLVVPCDEAAVHLLQNIAVSFEGLHGPGGQLRVLVPPPVRELLLRSLGGEGRTFAMRTSRPASRRAAELLGIASPPSVPVPYLQIAETFAAEHGWPVVLTREGDTEGERVRICADKDELRTAYSELTVERDSPHGLVNMARRALWSGLTGFHLVGDLTRPAQQEPTLAVEAFIAGRPASYTAVAAEGRIIGGFASVAEQSLPRPSVAASVVRLVEDPLILDAGRKMIGRMTVTGFCGVDFVRDEAAGKLWFLKFNPRPTPLSHLGPLAGTDLCARLLASLHNEILPRQQRTKQTTVALFPQDWMRDPEAADRHAEHLDLPQDDERLLAALKHLLPRSR